MGWSFPTHREVKAHIEEQEREARKKIMFEPPTLVASLIVLANVVISLVLFVNPKLGNVFADYGFRPALLGEFRNLHTLFTHMLLHADFLHITINMLVFLSFAPQCERKMGKLHFLSFCLLSGVFASSFYFLFNMSSDIPVVGASGAVFGVLAVSFVFFPEREVYLSVGFTRHRVPAIAGITLIFFVETAFAVISALIGFSYIAYLGHIGGLIAGLILLAVIYPKPAKRFLSVLLDALIPLVPEFPHEGRENSWRRQLQKQNRTCALEQK